MMLRTLGFASLALLGSLMAHAEDPPIATGSALPKVVLRGEPQGMRVLEMRMSRRNDVLVVHADMENTRSKDMRIYYRFRWLDANGNPVGDGEAWKQQPFMGKQIQTLKGVAVHPSASDFRLEMNVEAP